MIHQYKINKYTIRKADPINYLGLITYQLIMHISRIGSLFKQLRPLPKGFEG